MSVQATIATSPARYDYSGFARLGPDVPRLLASWISLPDVLHAQINEKIRDFNSTLFTLAVDERMSTCRLAEATTLPVWFVAEWRSEAGV